MILIPLLILNDNSERKYWCGYYDGLNGHTGVDGFSHDDPDYIMGFADGEGDLEILSDRTPN